MANQKPEITLGYKRPTDYYYVDQIRGNRPTVNYRRDHGGGTHEWRTIKVGDWLDAGEVEILGSYAVLIVRLYPVDA